MLKDSWKDKINGESIVDAEDINEIAHSIINLEKSGGASVEVVQETGESTEAVMSQKATTDALAGKVNKIANSWKVYTSGIDGELQERLFSDANRGGYFAVFGDGKGNHGNSEGNGYLTTADPINPYHCANKKWVDGKVQPLEQGVYNALGTAYTTEEVTDFGVGISIPSGAMKYAYIESLGVINGCDNDGKVIGECVLRGVTVGENNYEIQTPMYIEIPDGAISIGIEADVPTGTLYTQGNGGKIVFQVKVGG